MSVDRRLLNWGIFLVLLGVLPLAAHQGWISADTLGRAWQLWPLLLIGSGVGLILSRTRFAFLGGLIVAATFGIIIGGAIAGGFNLANFGCGGSSGAGAPVLIDNQHGSFGPSPRVELRLNCGTLNVAPATGAEWTLTATGDERTRPVVTPGSDLLLVRSPEGIVFPPFGGNRSATWTVGLPAGPAIDLRAELNASDARVSLAGLTLSNAVVNANAAATRLDLGSTSVARIDLEVNAADLRVTLPTAGTVGSISANAASVHLCAQPGAHLRFSVGDSTISSDNFGSRGLVRVSNTWETPGAAGPVVDLRLDGNAASFTLEGPEGCK